MQSSPSASLVSLCKEVDPCKNSQDVHILPYNSGTMTDSEESSVKANRKSTVGFPMSHQPRSCITPNLPKNNLKSATKFRCLKSSSGKSCSTVIPIECYHILARDDPVSIKFSSTGTDPQDEGCTLHVSHMERYAAVQSELADLVLWVLVLAYISALL